ncbi:uridine-preferring nucleoside hydrolase UriH [Propionibacterium australiense]|uniref:Nucleoside hydrolase n=1 Tax=Propionibacterium australiense TaxID=119981 RepID=A0A383S748_9ACTN|nr:nucleoside hydrolase [Propionibacterium australiense]RLP07701.1 nucleoside hydrolase [Propionibacterium australiense]RLP08128.1 nucleoside hydrolase [Propionibacterium australiense]SYZ33663.1 Inosine/uridine-preferring nucleoside hydrolase domain [Propionibacterium australiense]VEH92988.1 Pyrimidine-specific ribonucleoside hydrolase rihB [Propionibacterium australiense]
MAASIILDCDPGHDDAIAILMALGSPQIDLIGITTVGGNHGLDKVTYNARAVCEVAGFPEVPVHAGARRPLIREAIDAAGIHGETGLDGVELPEPTRALPDRHAVDWMIGEIMAREPGTVVLVPTGPLTNIALAARLEPRIVDRVKEVVLMGGAHGPGNATPVAEFNILCDPEAAHIVFNESWPVTMIGLDVTHRALCTPEVQGRLCAANPRLAGVVNGLMDFFRATYQDQQAFPDPPTHDPCAVAHVIDPTIVQTRRAPLDVEIRGQATYGMTIADMRAEEDPECRTRVGTDLDVERFWNTVEDAFRRLPQG